MKIDPKTEKLIKLKDVPSLPWLPVRGEGKAVPLSTVYCWTTIGISGVKLETIRAPMKCTTEAALMRFFEKISEPPAPLEPTTSKAHAAANARLDAMGI